MPTIAFHPLTLADKDDIRAAAEACGFHNCDLCVMNLVSWRFLYDTEVAFRNGMMLIRFRINGHSAYQMPVGTGNPVDAFKDLYDDAERLQEPFLMLGVSDDTLELLEREMPGHFFAHPDRVHFDYVYRREVLATLAGKHLQQKRNHVNRFVADHPDYVYEPLTPAAFDECIALSDEWAARKAGTTDPADIEAEHRAILNAFDAWEALDGRGGTIRIGGRLVAFTFGSAITTDTFDVCIEKADTDVDGAFAIINRDFARSLPEAFIFVNREEDLGIEGLRRSKMSYRPDHLLRKHTIMSKHPLGRTTD